MKIINKKAIMVDFLVTILLAIIIFAPACYVSSTYFRLSDQSKQNFMNFIDTVREVEKTTDSHKTAQLILDEGTAIIYFESNQKELVVDVDSEFPNIDYQMIFVNPPVCSSGKGCLCLFRDPEFELMETAKYKATESKPYCQEFSLPLKIDPCGFGNPHEVLSYTCSGGFLIERHLAAKSNWDTDSYFEVARRTQISLSNEGDMILFTKDEPESQ